MATKIGKKASNDYGVQGKILTTANGIHKYHMYLDMFTEIMLGQFKWENVPKEIDKRYMELSIFGKGSALFFKDDVIGYACLGNTSFGKWNLYGIPMERMGYGANGAQFKRDNTNSVIIWNNLRHKTEWEKLGDFAAKLALLDEIIMMNANAQKTPILIKCNEQQRLTLLNLYQKYEGNEPFIFADNGLDTSGFQVLGTGAAYTCDKLYDLKMQIWNEALTYLGVVNVQVTKKERMFSAEVERLNGGTMALRQTRLEARQQAVEEINEMFGLNIKVSFVDDNTEDDGSEETDENVSRETMGVDYNG